MDEDALVKKLQEIERSLAGGEVVGVEASRAELAAWREREADKEFRVSVPTPTHSACCWGVSGALAVIHQSALW